MRPKSFSLSTLIDVSLASPHERVRRVKDARDLYLRSETFPFDPDYYRPVKDALEELLRKGHPPEWLATHLDSLSLDKTRRRHSLSCATGIGEWLRKSRPTWVSKPRLTTFRESNATVRVNPELLVVTKHDRHLLLKLYLKESEATQAKLAGPLYVLDVATRESRAANVTPGIFDARRGRVFTARRLPVTAAITAASEVESLASIWDRLDARAA